MLFLNNTSNEINQPYLCYYALPRLPRRLPTPKARVIKVAHRTTVSNILFMRDSHPE